MAQMTGGYVPGSAYFDFRQMREADTQRQQKTQLQNLDIARQQMEQAEARRNLPLLEQQRQLKMGEVGGKLAQQPDVLSREAALTHAAAAPGRVAADIEGLDLESQAKVRAAKLKQQADEMDIVARTLDPVMTAANKGDMRGANDAMEKAFGEMEKAGVPGVAQWRLMPRDQALKQLQGHYSHAINNAPAIRERIKADEQHKRDLEKIKAQERIRMEFLRKEAEKAAKEPTTPNAVIARSMEKYRKGGDMEEDEKGVLRQYLESKIRDNDEVMWQLDQEAGSIVTKENAALSPREREAKEPVPVRKRRIINRAIQEYVKRDYPRLYANPAPKPLELKGIPAGSKLIGQTPGGKNVYLTPDNKQVVED